MRNKYLGTGEAGFHPIRKIKVILSGLRYAALHDASVAWKLAVSVIVLILSFAYREWIDFLLIFTVTALMLVMEIFNTAIEAICDYLKTDEDRRIKAIKDMAAAAAGIGILVWAVAIVYELVTMRGS